MGPFELIKRLKKPEYCIVTTPVDESLQPTDYAW